jgi:hypothetical protein
MLLPPAAPKPADREPDRHHQQAHGINSSGPKPLPAGAQRPVLGKPGGGGPTGGGDGGGTGAALLVSVQLIAEPMTG